MNILVFSWRGPKHPNAGGAEQVMHEHMKGWVKAGHMVTLFSSRFTGCRKYEKSGNMEIFHEGDQYIGVKINAFKFWLKNHEKFDLVVDQFHGIPFFTPLYIRKPKLAVLQEVAREVWFLNGFPFPLNYIIGIIGFLGEPFIFLFYKKVPFMVGSESAREDLVKIGIPKENITIVPHGVIVNKPKNIPYKEKKKTIMFLGVLTKDKGIEDAIKCFSLLNKKGDYQFWVVGKGSKKCVEKLVDLCKKLKVDNKTKFWGYVDQKKKFELLSKSRVLINPSIREGWGLVNIEANSVGTPVVAYKSAGLVDSVKDRESGIIIKSNTPEKMAKEVNKLVSDKKEYEKLVKGAKDWSKQFSWVKSRMKSKKLIDTMVSDFV